MNHARVEEDIIWGSERSRESVGNELDSDDKLPLLLLLLLVAVMVVVVVVVFLVLLLLLLPLING